MNETENIIELDTKEDVVDSFEEETHLETEKEEPDELSLLKDEIESLRSELNLRKEMEEANSRMLLEFKEFAEYFPEVNIHQIPDEVWEQVKGGASLSASFALNLRKIELERKKVSDFNEKNRRMSSGSLMRGDDEKYFSPSEVKRMTPVQVKLHYDDIVESMRHWN